MKKWLVSLSVLTGLVSASHSFAAQLSASPFIADSQANTTDYSAGFVSSADSVSFNIVRNEAVEPCGTYDGVVVRPWRPFQGFKKISFRVKGNCTTDQSEFQPGVIVLYGNDSTVIHRAFVPCSQGKNVVRPDGVSALEFSAAQFGIKQSDVVHSIVISDPTAAQPGQFLIGGIYVNDTKAQNDVKDGTLFYPVTDCSPTGPLGMLSSGVGASGNHTALTLTNASGKSVAVYLTLGAAGANTPCEIGDCVQDVTQVFSGMQQYGGPLVGTMTLAPGASVTYSGSQAIQGNIAFNGVFQNCPRSGFPNGQNVAEFTLNPPVGPNPTFPFQETVDISCVAGVNADIKMAMTNSSSQPDTTWANINGPVTSMENGTLNNNLNIPGVFPPGCDDCADRTTINPPPCFAGYKCNSAHICNVQRNQNLAGGTVTITFKGLE
jgi:hypothetical protein